MNLRIVKRLFAYIGKYRVFLFLAMACALFSVTLTLLGPVLIGRGIDHLLGPGQVNFPAVATILLWLAVTILIGALMQWLMALCTSRVSYLTVRDLRRDVFHHIQRLPLSYIDTHAHGDLMNRIVNDVDLISEGLLQGFTQLFSGVVTIVGTLLFMLSINVPIALVVVALTPLSMVIAAFISKRSYRTFVQQTKVQGELSGYIEEMLGDQKTVKAFGYEDRAQEKFEQINRRLQHWGLRAQIYPAFTNPITRFVNGLVYAAVGIAGALAAVSGTLSVGQLSSFLTYANQYTKPFNEVTGILAQLQTALSSASRVFQVLDEAPELPDPAFPQVIERADGQVSIKDVSFRYTPEKPFIENLSLEAMPGQRIAIVGSTGSGKTTLINLLMRFYEVNSGEILIDDISAMAMTRKNLRGQFGMVLQDTWLTAATVRDNIAYGRPEASFEEIQAAAMAAHAHGFIMRLEKGYDTLLAENGGNLSQGEKQLLSIARVMLCKPPMLILDEATSSIDTRTEILVQQAFLSMMEGRTSFVVAHRLSTIQSADTILVMENGHIVEQGTHDSLLAIEGLYAKLYNSQFAR